MGGKIARCLRPFDRRLTIGLTIGTRFVYDHSFTPLAGLHDGIASSPVVGTAILLHEDTFCSYFNGLTNHGTQPPFLLNLSFYVENDWDLLFLKLAQKKELPNPVTRFGLLPIEIPYSDTNFKI